MSLSAMSNTVEQSDNNIVTNASKADSTDMTDSDYKHALQRAKADAMETAAALENLVEGIQAVKRILEHPIDTTMEEKDDNSTSSSSVVESSDAELVSKLSNKLVGVLGSELIGLLNAAQMTNGHAKLRIEDDTKAIQDLHRAREFANKLHHRAVRAESIGLRLKAQKKLLIKEVRSLQKDRQLLAKEVRSMQKMLLMEDHLRGATMVHESVLTNKTFTSGFASIDPPGAKVKKDSDMDDRNNNNHEDDCIRVSIPSEKENNVQHAYFPWKDGDEEANHSMDRVVNYTNGTCSSHSKPSNKSKPTPTSKSNSTTPSKQRGLWGGFKNVLQEANNNMRDQVSPDKDHGRAEATNYCQDQKQQLPPPREKLMDDEATKSTKSCSFENDTTMNLSTSIISCSDDEMTNDLTFQISIDERYTSSPPTLMITPESSPLGQSSNEFLKPMSNPKVLQTLAIPNANTAREETRETSPTQKRPLQYFNVRS